MAKTFASYIMISNLMKLQDVFNLIIEKKVGTFSGAGIIFFDGKNVLLLKKKNGRWVFPGGKPIQGETPLQTAKRECKEEVGSCPGHQKAELVFGYDDRTFYSFIFKVDISFNIRLSKEHEDYTWIDFKKIKEMKLHKNVLKNLEKVNKALKELEVDKDKK